MTEKKKKWNWLKEPWGLSGSILKAVAMISMVLDHTGMLLVPPGTLNLWLRAVGRLAFPLYCLLLTEGYVHTRSYSRYLIRLLLFALISEIPFDLAVSGRWFDLRSQNVFFTLALGLAVLPFVQQGVSRQNLSLPRRLFCLGAAGAGLILAGLLETDYSYRGVLLIIALFLTGQAGPWGGTPGRFGGRLAVTALYGLLFASPVFFGAYAAAGVLIYLYNGQKGKLKGKYVFYWFYPVHLLILWAIQRLLLRW